LRPIGRRLRPIARLSTFRESPGEPIRLAWPDGDTERICGALSDESWAASHTVSVRGCRQGGDRLRQPKRRTPALVGLGRPAADDELHLLRSADLDVPASHDATQGQQRDHE